MSRIATEYARAIADLCAEVKRLERNLAKTSHALLAEREKVAALERADGILRERIAELESRRGY